MDTSKVTRFELITDAGRDCVLLGVKISLSLQDDGRTLKIFVDKHPDVSAKDVHEAMTQGLHKWNLTRSKTG